MGVSTHLLDTSRGRPAAGVPVSLSRRSGENWSPIHTVSTDSDGRCKYLLPEGEMLVCGVYRIRFDTSVYYDEQRLPGLYPSVDIVFTVLDATQHYHLPLLLTANGYTTYRGS